MSRKLKRKVFKKSPYSWKRWYNGGIRKWTTNSDWAINLTKKISLTVPIYTYCLLICSLNFKTGRRKKGRDGAKFSRRPSQRFPHQNFFANLVNVFHTKNFFADIVYVFKSEIFPQIWSTFCEMWWTIVNCCPIRPLGENFHDFLVELFAPQVRWAGILIRNSLLFI